MFKQSGYMTLACGSGTAGGANNLSADEIELKAIDAGASDVKADAGVIEIYTEPSQLMQIKKSLENAGLKPENAELTFVPANIVKITDAEKAKRILDVLDMVEENEDVVNVYSNFDIDAAVMEKL
jgi:transcriptional/translational regulatory protein YebC/TACO1